ncbi:MAG: DUF429 domain-containing protein [Rubricella sp.]
MTPVGVDGCKGGWLAVAGRPPRLSARFFPTFADLLEAHPDAMVVVDMPIGFAEGREGRIVDGLMRGRLGSRRSSVFAPPCRDALYAEDYATANAINRKVTGKGLSKQAWMIAAKMREVDAAITADLQGRIREGHPEVAFTEAAGAPMTHHKTKLHGLFARLAVLQGLGIDPANLIDTLPPDIAAQPDDLIDACILAHVAARCIDGTALRLPDDPARDARGLAMEIWA